MPAPAVIAVRLAFAYGDAVPLFDEVSFHLTRGFWGLVGDNGAGKTTLLRLIAGELSPASGALRVLPDAARIVTCAQSVEEPPPGAAELADPDGDAQAHRLRARLELSAEELLRWPTLSPGERKRWQIGAALHAAPDVLLLDEPTNHLDARARALLVTALRDFRGIGIVISHDRVLLDALTCGTLAVREGAVVSCPLPYTEARAVWAAEAAARAAERQAARDRLHAASRRLDAARRAQDGATRHRSAAVRMKDRNDSDARSLGADNLVSWAQAGAGRRVAVHRAAVAQAAAALAATMPQAKAKGRSVALDWAPPPRPILITLTLAALRAGAGASAGSGDQVLAREVALTLGRDDRVHVRGDNGSGKSTLLAALLAASTLPPERVLHLPQDLSAAAARALLTEVRRQPPELRGRTLSLVAALGVSPDRLLASVQPSPGEARKLALALALARHVWLLVLDEPENHLDLASIERLEDALADYPGALVLVSHDDALAARLTCRTWRLADGRVALE